MVNNSDHRDTKLIQTTLESPNKQQLRVVNFNTFDKISNNGNWCNDISRKKVDAKDKIAAGCKAIVDSKLISK